MTFFFCHSREARRQLEESRERLYRVAYSWCHDAALADDLTQEALSKALKNWGQIREPAMLRSWLFSILSNCWRDYFRGQRDDEDIGDFEDQLCAAGPSPEQEHETAQLVARVREVVAWLPLGQRQVLSLVDLEEMSYAEVAAVLAIPVGTVMSRLCRARRALKEQLLAMEQGRPGAQPRIRRIK